MARLAVLVLCAILAGCAAPGEPRWGANATWSPGWERVKAAAWGAAIDPGTWIPTAGAAVIVAGGSDKRLSDHYWDKRPVFGTIKRAVERSDELRTALHQAHFVTMMLTPSGATAGEWFADKGRGLLVEESALGASRIGTNLIKKNVSRKVPNFDPVTNPDYESFPSNHGTEPFADAALIRRNLAAMPINDAARFGLNTATYLAASGAAWGRVEMGLHYPNDMLLSAAIGNFIALFVHDAFMGEEGALPSLGLGPAGWYAGLGWQF